MECNGFFHKQTKCSSLTRDAVEAMLMVADYQWTCKDCEEKESRDYNTQPPNSNTVSEQVKGERKDSLKILQWNADGLSTKIFELRDRLLKDDIDICNIQETKLKANAKTPYIQGYKSTKRADRRGGIQGGGLITYIKDSIVYMNGPDSSTNATEVTNIRAKLDKKSWVSVSNVYCPPPHSTGQVIEFKPEAIPTPEEAIITGDLNGHSPLWDVLQNPDQGGEQIEEWMFDKELSVLNDASHTRINRATGGFSTPDVTLVGKKWNDKCTWKVGE